MSIHHLAPTGLAPVAVAEDLDDLGLAAGVLGTPAEEGNGGKICCCNDPTPSLPDWQSARLAERIDP
jgi:hypothetical protein